MTDSKYFTTTKKGEIFELKSELNNDKKEKKKEAVKKVSWTSRLTARIDNGNESFSGFSLRPLFRSLRAWLWVRMCRRCFPMWSIACKPIIWNWRSWSICIWWITPNRSRIWPLWPSIHSSRFVMPMHFYDTSSAFIFLFIVFFFSHSLSKSFYSFFWILIK